MTYYSYSPINYYENWSNSMNSLHGTIIIIFDNEVCLFTLRLLLTSTNKALEGNIDSLADEEIN